MFQNISADCEINGHHYTAKGVMVGDPAYKVAMDVKLLDQNLNYVPMNDLDTCKAAGLALCKEMEARTNKRNQSSPFQQQAI